MPAHDKAAVLTQGRRRPLSPLRIGVIVDELRIARWQVEALRTIADGSEFVIYNCINSPRPKRRLNHAFYYLLNLWAIRNKFTVRIPLPADLPILDPVEFKSINDGQWQSLAPELLQTIAADPPALILKFGMGLLRVPSIEDLPIPILSYHHGDPQSFRGRPAGFYELLHGSDRVGQVVQLLSNELDAGDVVAFGESKAHRHSYRATLLESYARSPLLLPKAIANALSGRTIAMAGGRNYRLPSNWTVARFCAQRIRHLVSRLMYGAFVEKHWQVAQAPTAVPHPWAELESFPPPADWRIVPTPREYRFLADPFFHPDGDGILVEALRRSTGDGDIVHMSADGHRTLLSNRHFSYPATLTIEASHFVTPEMGTWSTSKFFRLDGPDLREAGELDIPGQPRLIDPTLFQHSDAFFLFANTVSEAPGVLRLWFTDSPYGRFTEHPCSPIRISPAGSRMGGAIIGDSSGLFRIGQDYAQHYGDGVIVFEITQLSKDQYQETERAQLRFAHVRGPHTLNFRDGRILFDFYTNSATPWAGVRRLRARTRTS